MYHSEVVERRQGRRQVCIGRAREQPTAAVGAGRAAS